MSGVNKNSCKLNGGLLNSNTTIVASTVTNKSQQNQEIKSHHAQQIAKQQTIKSGHLGQSGTPQIHTVASVHHQSSTSSTASKPANNQCTQRNHQQRVSKGSAAIDPPHIIPPRYQPPPQPPSGILKHLSSGKSAYYPSTSADLNTSHFNIKYPPDIPKLSSVYIPDSVKAQGNPTRFIQQRSIPLHRGQLLLSASEQENHLRHHHQQQTQDMLKFVRKSEQESNLTSTTITTPTGIPSATRLTSEQNRQLQPLINELRALKEANQRLVDDNQELRDLCCFLDDDRQKGRKLAREWQRFGRYTASVMRQEVSAYQSKLRQLDDKQQELITDNLELKELCLYLDEERAHVAANAICVNCGTPVRGTLRDDGDGSSSSTNADESISTLRNYERQFPDIHLRSTLSDQTLQYVRSLERRIQQLEEERLSDTTNVSHVTPEPIPGRPEAVIRALQVLEVREQLERDRFGNLSGMPIEQMDDGEKALVREMCNVVWRKLEGNNSGPTMEE